MMIYQLPRGNLKKFPPVDTAEDDGLLAIEGTLTIPNLVLAYKSGIFPWPAEGLPLLWFAPPERGVLDFDEFHIPSRFQRDLKKVPFEFRMNTCFQDVMRLCAQAKNRKNQKGTWITDEMIDAYTDLHQSGLALSFEAWHDGTLVGGMYGVWIKPFFAGESLFFKKTGASKFCLVKAVEWLKQQGTCWMDIQMVTPLLKSFGAKEIPREKYIQKLKSAIAAEGIKQEG